MPEAFDARQLIADIQAASESGDYEKILSHYADDAEVWDPSLPSPIRGKEAIRASMEQWMGAFTERRTTLREMAQSGDTVALLMETKARHTGELTLAPGETIPPTNKTGTVLMADFLKIRNGKIVSDTTVYDMAGLMQQLGLMPSPQGAGRAEPARATRGR